MFPPFTVTTSISVSDVYGHDKPDIPKGWRASEFRLVARDEYYIAPVGLRERATISWGTSLGPRIILTLPKRYVFEETGEKRRVLTDEYYLHDETIYKWSAASLSDYSYVILRKIEQP